MQMSKNKDDISKKLMTVRKKAGEINYEKPKGENLMDEKTKKEIEETISNEVYLLNNGQTCVSSKSKTISVLLRINQRDAKKYIAQEVPDSEKIRTAEEVYIRSPQLKKDIDDRMDANTTVRQKEELRFISEHLNNINCSNETMECKKIGADYYNEIDKENKREKRKKSEYDEITGDKLEKEFHIHHDKEKARTPGHISTETNNYIALNEKTHKELHRTVFQKGKTFEEKKEEIKRKLEKKTK